MTTNTRTLLSATLLLAAIAGSSAVKAIKITYYDDAACIKVSSSLSSQAMIVQSACQKWNGALGSVSNVYCDATTGYAGALDFMNSDFATGGVNTNCGMPEPNNKYVMVNYSTIMPIYAYTFNSTDNTTKTTMTMGTPVSPLTCSSTEADCATTKNKLGVCNNFASTVWRKYTCEDIPDTTAPMVTTPPPSKTSPADRGVPTWPLLAVASAAALLFSP